MRAASAVLLALALTGCASMDENRRDAYLAGMADCGTTAAGLSLGRGLVEANPLGPIAACALKPVAVEYAAAKPEPARTQGLHAIEAAWNGFAINNTAALINVLAHLGLSWPVPLGIGAAWAWWQWSQGADEREYAAICADWIRQKPGNVCAPFVNPA
jgi:hypothetical protein